MLFQDYQFKPFVQKALDKKGFSVATPIQAEVIPNMLAGKSLVVQSETGSGKSLAFLLPIFEGLEAKEKTQVVIVAPSRELADQLYQVALSLNQAADEAFTLLRAYGGRDAVRQKEKLDSTVPDLVIGTPGRLLDLVSSQALDVHEVKTLVIDEADMTLDMGFLHTIDQLASRMPRDLQIAVFSATVPTGLRPFLRKYLANPEWLLYENDEGIAPSIENILVPVKSADKIELLTQAMRIGEPYLALIFANTIEKVEELYQQLLVEGFNVSRLHGDLPSRERRRIMRQIKDLQYQFVVCTDLAARGIDIPGVSHVYNYELPGELAFFIHRVGRTGRLGQVGQAITFYEPDEITSIQWLESKGIQFDEKVQKNGEWQTVNKRSQRQNGQKGDVDHQIQGMIKKAKKQQVKPGYKKKLQRDIKTYKRQKAKNAQRQEDRRKRKARKNSQKW